MTREGEQDVTLRYLSGHSRTLECRQISRNSSDARSLYRYSNYLQERVKQFSATKVDYVRQSNRLRNLTIERGLLREVESVIKQIGALLKCKFHEEEVNNDIVLTAFRMLVNDLLSIYQALNEGVINILEHYFEMSKFDAERALDIYKDFVRLTSDVVAYLKVAKHLEYITKLHVPNIKHAPTLLTKSLEEYLHDPDFEINRRQFLAEKEGQKNKSKTGSEAPQTLDPQKSNKNAETSRSTIGNAVGSQSQVTQAQVPAQTGIPIHAQVLAQTQQADLFSFPLQEAAITGAPYMVQQPIQLQATGYNPWGVSVQQQPNPAQVQIPVQNFQQTVQAPLMAQHTAPLFSPMQMNQFTGFQQQQPQQPQPQQQQQQLQIPLQSTSTGAGFGGYSPQNYGQEPLAVTPTGSNPFRKSIAVLSSGPFSQPTQETPQRSISLNYSSHHKANPFAKPGSLGSVSETAPQPLQSQKTGTNPFSSTFTSAGPTPAFSAQPAALASQPTGSNPFRGMDTGAPMKPLKAQPTFGGLEKLSTIPVFPETKKEAQYEQQLQYQKAQVEAQKQEQINLQLQQQQQMQIQMQLQQQQQQQLYMQQTGGYIVTQQTGMVPQATSTNNNQQQVNVGYVEPPSLI